VITQINSLLRSLCSCRVFSEKLFLFASSTIYHFFSCCCTTHPSDSLICQSIDLFMHHRHASELFHHHAVQLLAFVMEFEKMRKKPLDPTGGSSNFRRPSTKTC
jgi:hypothetical protein